VAANTSPPSSSSSSFSTSQTSSGKTTPSSGSKSKTGPIVGGIIGGLAAVALVIGGIFFYLHSQRKKAGQSQNQGHNPEAAAANPAEQSEKQVAPVVSSEKTAVKERPVSPVSPVSSPVDAAANAKKPAGGRAEPVEKENEPFVNVAQVGAPNVTELQGEGRHGLRPEELDANGQYIGELHGDGRQFTSSELP
jgi:hypothetical protein